MGEYLIIAVLRSWSYGLTSPKVSRAMVITIKALLKTEETIERVWSKPVGESQRSRLNNHLLVGVVLQSDQLLLTTPLLNCQSRQ